MTANLDRVSGVFFVILGIVLYVWIIPAQTETVAYGWMRPATVPRAMAVVIALGGLWAALRPVSLERPHPRPFLRAVAFLAILAAGLYAIDLAGFVRAAPFIALAILLTAHERRPLWLAVAAIAVPFVIWLSVAIVLERPLP
jgi:putative tricarboxylic transport membrane protein